MGSPEHSATTSRAGDSPRAWMGTALDVVNEDSRGRFPVRVDGDSVTYAGWKNGGAIPPARG